MTRSSLCLIFASWLQGSGPLPFFLRLLSLLSNIPPQVLSFKRTHVSPGVLKEAGVAEKLADPFPALRGKGQPCTTTHHSDFFNSLRCQLSCLTPICQHVLFNSFKMEDKLIWAKPHILAPLTQVILHLAVGFTISRSLVPVLLFLPFGSLLKPLNNRKNWAELCYSLRNIQLDFFWGLPNWSINWCKHCFCAIFHSCSLNQTVQVFWL